MFLLCPDHLSPETEIFNHLTLKGTPAWRFRGKLYPSRSDGIDLRIWNQLVLLVIKSLEGLAGMTMWRNRELDTYKETRRASGGSHPPQPSMLRPLSRRINQ